MQALPMVPWVTDEGGPICEGYVVPEDGMQEELGKWRVGTLGEREVLLASSVEG